LQNRAIPASERARHFIALAQQHRAQPAKGWSKIAVGHTIPAGAGAGEYYFRLSEKAGYFFLSLAADCGTPTGLPCGLGEIISPGLICIFRRIEPSLEGLVL